MPLKLVAASAGTLAMLMGSVVFVLVTAIALTGNVHPLLFLATIPITLFISFIGWAVGPFFTDLMQGWFYKLEKLSFDEFERRHPQVGAFMRQTCQANGLPLPMIRLVHDDNPTAYTYGSLPGNARVALSQGLFRFLDTDEICAVAAHELGHVKHYDFAVMSFAHTLLMVLYELYWFVRSMSRRNRRNGQAFALVALGAYVLWWIGTYAVLYLSRTREYMADRFAAEAMADPAPLQRALVKIAYGLAEVQQTQANSNLRLLQSTRTLGIADPSSAHSLGNAMYATEGNAALQQQPPIYGQPGVQSVAQTGGGTFNPQLIEPVFLFDLFNPWATVSELKSTHPLTGKRIRELNNQAFQLGKRPLFQFAEVDRQGQALDKGRLYGKFFLEVGISMLPWVLPALCLFASLFLFVDERLVEFFPAAMGIVIGACGFGMLVKGWYRFSVGSDFQPTTMYALMCDPYVSPMRGIPVELDGVIIGKATAGSRFDEDMQMKDRSGGLVMLNYESMFGFIGNFFSALGKAQRAIGQQAYARGWFRRGMSQLVDLSEMQISDGTNFSSWTRFWGMAGGVIVMMIGAAVCLVGASFLLT